MRDKLFGYLGIDTKYERELVYYRPILEYLRKPSYRQVEGVDLVYVNRAQEYRISDVLDEYDYLIRELNQLIEYIEEEEPIEAELLKGYYEANEEVSFIVSEVSKRDDIESYYLFDKYPTLLYMRDNLSNKRQQVLETFANRYTEIENTDAIRESEDLSISEWEALITASQDIREKSIYQNVHMDEEDDHPIALDDSEYTADMLVEVERLEQEKERFHRNMGDVAFTHLTFIEDCKDLLEVQKILILNPRLIIEENNPLLERELKDVPNKQEVLKALRLDFFERANHFYTKLKGLEEIRKGASPYLTQKADYYHSVREELTAPLAEAAITANSITDGPLDELVQILSRRYVVEEEGYLDLISDMYNNYRQESGILFEIIDGCLEKEKIKRYYILLDSLTL